MNSTPPFGGNQPAGIAQAKLKPVWPFLVVLNAAVLWWPLTYVAQPIPDFLVSLSYPIVLLITLAAALGLAWATRGSAETIAGRASLWPYIVTVATAVLATVYTSYYTFVDKTYTFCSNQLRLCLRGMYGGFIEDSTHIPVIAALIGLAGASAALTIRVKESQKQPTARPSATDPIGHTTDGQPIYPVVGYTPDGKPVTADRAVGVQPTAATGTNSMAIVALVTGLTIAPLGVIFGHIALSQIKQTGQGGKGMAIAGLVLGYIGLVSWIIIIAATVAGASGAF